MKTFAALTLALVLGGAATPPAASAVTNTYTVDAAHSEVSFRIKHIVTWVRGQFDTFDATIVMDTEEPSRSSVRFTIDAASINTFNSDRDQHRRAEDFFHVSAHPSISFTSTSVRSPTPGRYLVTGDFTMRGVTKVITLPVSFDGEATDPWGNVKAGFSTETSLDRKDFGILWNKSLDTGGFILGDEVQIAINIEAARKAD